MLIDCAGCGIRGSGCADCLVTVLLDDSSPAAGLGGAEARAIEVFARAGFEVEVLPTPRPAGRPTRRRRVA
ncbi:hypothetical protein KBX06_07090 [Micromonospora sp. C31]|uniref:hypothetical protein n=1 Tax=Micromonospora sp. C31 TaxID=2824876 RepID=UPI001B375035|nr:hypothetical protein [Micromonospora sp. C31]MBQ1072927.1 hypothetical protein [Micromonospora sp. C31]